MTIEPPGPSDARPGSPAVLLAPFTPALMHAAISGRRAFVSEVHRVHGLGVAEDWPNPEIAGALPFIAAHVGESPGLELWQWLIVERATSRVVGEIGFKSPPRGGAAEIGYGVCASARGRGYASEAAALVLARAFATPGIECVTAECLSENAGSVRVLEKAGFARTRVDGGMIHWAARRRA